MRGGPGGRVGCERRIEVFVKIIKNEIGGGGGGSGGRCRVGGVRVDVIEEMKFLGKFTIKKMGGGGSRGGGLGRGGGSGWCGGSGWM